MSAKTAALILTALVAIISYVRFIEQPRRDEETRLFQSIRPADITRIEIQRASYNSLVQDAFTIQDPGQIQSLSEAMREARSFDASHPIARWNSQVCFFTAARTWCATISSTTNGNGVLIYLEGGHTLRNDSLGPMLEEITQDHAPSHPPPPRP